MKKPRPLPPRDAPVGTIWVGGAIPWFALSLEIRADDLKPAEITSLLGVDPTETQEKGQPVSTPACAQRMSKFGRWSIQLRPEDTDEWDATEAAKLLVGKIPADAAVWKSIASTAEIRLCVAVALESFNQGLSIDRTLLRFLADREIRLDIDIYASDEGEDPNAGADAP